MTLCLDIHTHHPAPQPQAVVAVSFQDFQPMDGQLYSIGIHPWTTTGPMPSKEDWETFERLAQLPEVVAIGECGVDKLKGGPMFKQLIVMNKQIEISEKLHKPLIIHDVKAHDVIVGLKRDLNPSQKWLVHGFRGKPTVVKMLTDAGIYLSFGEKFNPESLPLVPKNMLLAETDESSLTIEEIIANLSASFGYDITELIAQNTQDFLLSKD
ncbi:MAG: TatD family hydrolase [Muribaculaceae bacterium]|nr:TatD family hydrolase [Muribaculaceae bacterium]